MDKRQAESPRPDPDVPLATAGQPVRVALFSGNYNYTRDGANQALNRLVAYLDAHGFDVRVYSPVNGSPAFKPAGDLVPVPSAPIPLRPDYRLAKGLTREIQANLAGFAPQIVHLSTPDLLGWEAQRFARRCNVPVVASVHTRFETYLRYYGLGWLRPAADAYLLRFYRGCDYVLAPNGLMAEEMAAAGLEGKVRIWGRGVDRTLFDPRRRDVAWRRSCGFADDDVVVLFFGRLVREKGLAVFARTLALANARDRRVRMLVVGDGPARRWFEKRAPGAVFAGSLTGEALARAVASADILFNPSVTEAFSNVTLEAMAAGLAVLCADASAHRALTGQDAGLLRPPGDAAAFAQAILDLAADPLRRKSLGALARRASARFTWEAALDSVVSVYAEAVGARPGAVGPPVPGPSRTAPA